MKLFDPESRIMTFFGQLADLVILNVLWLVFCLPIFTIGASTTAMYRVTLNMVRQEGGGVVKTFWAAFRLNFKQGVLIFLITLLPILLVSYELWLFLSGAMGQNVWTGVVFSLPAILVTLVLSYVYPLLAQFDNSIKNTLKNACLLALSQLPVSLLMGALNLSALLVFFFATPFFLKTGIFWLAIGGSLVALINSYLLRRVFKKVFHLET